MCGRRLESAVIVTDHPQQRSPKIMHLQGGLRVESEHECPKVAAVLLQFPSTIHFQEGKNFHARGTESMVGGVTELAMSSPNDLTCNSIPSRVNSTSTTHNANVTKCT